MEDLNKQKNNNEENFIQGQNFVMKDLTLEQANKSRIQNIIEGLKELIKENSGVFSEKILITDDGSLKPDINQSRFVFYGTRGAPSHKIENLYKLAKEISDTYPKLSFSFNHEEGKFIEYTVKLKA